MPLPRSPFEQTRSHDTVAFLYSIASGKELLRKLHSCHNQGNSCHDQRYQTYIVRHIGIFVGGRRASRSCFNGEKCSTDAIIDLLEMEEEGLQCKQ